MKEQIAKNDSGLPIRFIGKKIGGGTFHYGKEKAPKSVGDQVSIFKTEKGSYVGSWRSWFREGGKDDHVTTNSKTFERPEELVAWFRKKSPMRDEINPAALKAIKKAAKNDPEGIGIEAYEDVD